MSDESTLQRTRVIPIGDFYTRLQLEYVCYRLRALIYQRAFDKKKFVDICAKKREKIEQIALENRLPSVFNNAAQQQRYIERFFGVGGLPAFCYRDDYQTRVKGYWDITYYYAIGSSVSVISEGETLIGAVKRCNIKTRQVSVQLETGSIIDCAFDVSTRIFPGDFFSHFFDT